jgi:hypothetical protein
LVLSMCSTQPGYKTRIDGTVDMIGQVLPELLSDSDRRGGDDVFDDALEILKLMHRACHEILGRKGKQRSG